MIGNYNAMKISGRRIVIRRRRRRMVWMVWMRRRRSGYGRIRGMRARDKGCIGRMMRSRRFGGRRGDHGGGRWYGKRGGGRFDGECRCCRLASPIKIRMTIRRGCGRFT